MAESLYSAVTTHLQEVWAFDYNDAKKLQSGDAAIDTGSDVDLLYVAKDLGEAASEKMMLVLGANGIAVGSEYFPDSIVVEYNPSSLQVYSVFYSDKINASEYYSEDHKELLKKLRKDAAGRKEEYQGYLGYYQADTQNLPALSDNEYGVKVGVTSKYKSAGDTLLHLRNLDELNAPIRVFIPDSEVVDIQKNKNMKIEITVAGKESGASAKIVYDESKAGMLTPKVIRETTEFTNAKMISFEIVLDNLEKGTFYDLFCKDKDTPNLHTTVRFHTNDDKELLENTVPIELIPNGSGGLFVPGEDIVVEVSSIVVDGDDKTFSANSERSAIDNSLFAYGSCKDTEESEDCYTAYLEYGRHLQNLDQDVRTKNAIGTFQSVPIYAYQADSIDFTEEVLSDENTPAEDKPYLWAALYSDKNEEIPYNAQRPFRPVANSEIKALRGDYRLKYETGEVKREALRDESYYGTTKYRINGIVIRQTGKTPSDAGVFLTFSGGEIRNITMTNPRISGDGVTGGLIAKASLKPDESLSITNCALYMTDEYTDSYQKDSDPYGIVEKSGSDDPDIQNDTDVKGIWMSGKKYTGGLIGEFYYDQTGSATPGSKPHLVIKYSHASTVIDASESTGVSGGLIGYTGTGGEVSLESSYADCYLYGRYTGGLIGRIHNNNKVTIEKVYTAGFQDGLTQAGFANGTIHTAASSYAFMQMNIDAGAKAYTTAEKITNINEVYYFPQNNANSGNIGSIIDVEGTTSTEDLSTGSQKETTGELLRRKLGSGFTMNNSGATYPYNLRDGMALSTYTKPRLDRIDHYGDWEEVFMPGSLVYYEKYKKTNSKIRFYGGNYNVLYDSLEEGEAVQADGYGIVFRESDMLPDAVEVTYFFAGATPGTFDQVTERIENLSTLTPLRAELEDQNYLIYPLSTENINHEFQTNTTFDAPFYTKVDITCNPDGANHVTDEFYFNPHFAKAVGYLGRKPDDLCRRRLHGNGHLRRRPSICAPRDTFTT